MKSIYLLIALLVSTVVCAQQPILLDTLATKEKEYLKNQYNKRKLVFFNQIDRTQDKEEVKEIKAIFEESYKTILHEIDQNTVLYDSPLNHYLNELTASIQKENPEISKDLSVLVSRKYNANAYNRGEGTIVVNNYLLDALDHEDQLVYILCHEMAHQTLDHVLGSVVKHVRANKSEELRSKTKQVKRQKYSRKTSAENLLLELSYKNSAANRAKEVQADSLGYVFYARLNRDPHQVANVLEKLRDSDKESDSLTVKDYIKIFDSFQLTTKERWFKMDSFEDYYYQKNTKFNTDSLRTHPNCDVRIERLAEVAPEIKDATLKETTQNSSTTAFMRWKESAVYQNIQNEYFAKHYGNSLYEALKLYNRKPDELLRKWIAMNFKKLYEAKKAYQLNRYVSQVNIIEHTDSYNLFSTFIFNLDLSDLEIIYKTI